VLALYHDHGVAPVRIERDSSC